MHFIKLIVLTLLIILFFSSSPLASALENFSIKTEPQKIYSDSPFYPIKRLYEKMASKILIFNDTKINYEKKLLNKRFTELKYSVENNLLDEIQRSSERFSFQAGIYTQRVNDIDDKKIKQKVISEFSRYASDSAILKSKVPEGSFTRLIQYNIDTLKILSNKLE